MIHSALSLGLVIAVVVILAAMAGAVVILADLLIWIVDRRNKSQAKHRGDK